MDGLLVGWMANRIYGQSLSLYSVFFLHLIEEQFMILVVCGISMDRIRSNGLPRYFSIESDTLHVFGETINSIL